MVSFDKWLLRACLAAVALACTGAVAQQPKVHQDAGKTVYHCDRGGRIGWGLEPCGDGQLLTTGRVRDNGTIEPDTPPPPIDLRPEAERAPPAVPEAVPAAPAVATPGPGTQTHRLGYIKNPWVWLLGFALVFGLVAKVLGGSFNRWAVVGAVTEFILVGLDWMPLK